VLVNRGYRDPIGRYSSPQRAAMAGGARSMQNLLVQLIGTIVAPASAIASPLAGKRIDQFGIHPVYISSVLIMAICGACLLFYDNLRTIFGFRLLLAVRMAGGFTTGISAASAIAGYAASHRTRPQQFRRWRDSPYAFPDRGRTDPGKLTLARIRGTSK
jgi:MFS family permease